MSRKPRIHKLLDEKGWSLLELARRANVGRERLRRMANRIPPSVAAAISVAKALGISVESLFGDTPDQQQLKQPTSKTSPQPHPDDVNLDLLRRELRKLLQEPQ